MNDLELLKAATDAIRSASESARDLEIHPQSRLIEDLGLDSLDIMSTLMTLQDEFQVEIDLDLMPNLSVVADLMSELRRQRQSSAA